MSDPIRDALRVACRTDSFYGTGIAGFDRECEARMAESIAAFLRALPDAALDTVPDVGYMDACACRNAWAAAVERAARGDA